MADSWTLSAPLRTGAPGSATHPSGAVVLERLHPAPTTHRFVY